MNTSATPKFIIGQLVGYFDHTGRPQSGRVLFISADWRGWSQDPHISYTVEHPTYKRKRIYIGEDGLT